MTQEWSIEGPRVLDIGGEDERVGAVSVMVVGGRVDVVTHDDSPTARLEVTSVEGLPVRVRWDGSTLRITHGKDDDHSVVEMIRRTVESFGRNKVVLSLSVPQEASASVSTVSATGLVSGVRAKVTANTVSGRMTLADLRGPLEVNTVSGAVDCTDVEGPLQVNGVSGAVTVQAGRLPTAEVNTVSGDIALDLLDGRCRVESNSVSGDVTVRAPLRGYDVEGHTATGQVVVDGRQLSAGGRRGGFGFGRGGQLSEGDGELRVRASAVSGSIVVLRSPGRVDGAGTPQDTPSPEADDGPRPGPQDAPHPGPQEEGR